MSTSIIPTLKRVSAITCHYSLLVAKNLDRVIGVHSDLLYDIPKDRKFVKKTTTKVHPEDEATHNVVVMGRNTWESIPSKFRPLPGRINVICSRSLVLDNDTVFDKSQDTVVIRECEQLEENLHTHYPHISSFYIYILGGSSIYSYFMPYYDTLYMTTILDKRKPEGSVLFPPLDVSGYKKTFSSPLHVQSSCKLATGDTIENLLYQVSVYEKPSSLFINFDENYYLELLSTVMIEGNERVTRNGKTLSLFGKSLHFDIRNNRFPLLTTKKVFRRGIIHELLWFVKGCTDSKLLESKKVNIWKGNSSREYLDSIGLSSYREGACGPIYGYQWRHFNAPYQGPDADYTGTGYDQLGECLRLIRENPKSRRIFMSAWNPSQMSEMCLPCCHVSYQWYVSNGELSCQMYQRSGDLFLGIPFNIASTALLTRMLAHLSGLQPGSITLCIGDAHIYEDHIEAVQTQLSRKSYEFPTMEIVGNPQSLEDFTYKSFSFQQYVCHPKISAPMNV